MHRSSWLIAAVELILIAGVATAEEGNARPNLANLPLNTWVKLTPLADTPVSPRLGYEGACAWDDRQGLMIRYGGHNQGGGGEQGSEIWTFEPRSASWKLHEANVSPPGICCGQQNLIDPISNRYVRFPAFSASHGWQWLREVYLNNSSVWTYDLRGKSWRNMRPLPTMHPAPLRCASWDSEYQVMVLFGGEGNSEGTVVYDPAQNTWTRMQPKPEPAFRSGGNMAYDRRNKVHILFGSQFNDDRHTWVYDLKTNEWRDMQPTVMPPTDKNDAVLAYDEGARRIIAVIKITTGKDDDATHRLETWSYDLTENAWKKLEPKREPDPTSSRARQLMYAPQLGVCLLENRPSNSSGLAEQQVWALRVASRATEVDQSAPPPILKSASVGRNGVTLSWTDDKPSPKPAYAVYRGSGPQPWKAELRRLAVVMDETGFEDPTPPADVPSYYQVRRLNADDAESGGSQRVSTLPSVIDELLVSVIDARHVELAWQSPPGELVAGFHVERATVEVFSEDQLKRLKAQTPPLESPSIGAIRRIGAFKPITTQPLDKATTTFVDDSIDLDRPVAIDGEPIEERKFDSEQFDEAGRPYRHAVYAYRVRAVNALGQLGGPSPAVLTVPSPPQFVFAKEEGSTCHLKWQNSSERNLRGYRIYRMDGRFGNDPIARLNAEPQVETKFSDPAAGKETRRYYIVAVDALGQEGFPSSPAWFNREWKAFYTPFTSEWHQ